MRICIDTNVLVQMFGRQHPFRALREALTGERVEPVVSNDILLEYEETITRLSGPAALAAGRAFAEGGLPGSREHSLH